VVLIGTGKYGNKQLQEGFLPDLLTGKRRTCIAITEPEAGSDVANITTTATKTLDGKLVAVVSALLHCFLLALFIEGYSLPTSPLPQASLLMPTAPRIVQRHLDSI
jgi:hypothetical protein